MRYLDTEMLFAALTLELELLDGARIWARYLSDTGPGHAKSLPVYPNAWGN